MIRKIDHVAIAVADLAAAVELFEKILGRKAGRGERVAEQRVETAEFDLGGTAIEIVRGTEEGSPVQKFVERRGPGLHHIGQALAELEAAGLRPVETAPRPGRAGTLVAFLHPGSASGVLVELVQKKADP